MENDKCMNTAVKIGYFECPNGDAGIVLEFSEKVRRLEMTKQTAMDIVSGMILAIEALQKKELDEK